MIPFMKVVCSWGVPIVQFWVDDQEDSDVRGQIYLNTLILLLQ